MFLEQVVDGFVPTTVYVPPVACGGKHILPPVPFTVGRMAVAPLYN
jgi:hypothetical protein